ncbi:molybdopterin molybdotransferase MoeA [Arthrobacter monumenti]
MAEHLVQPNWTDAFNFAFQLPESKVPQTLPLAETIGHTLAEDMLALMEVPHYDSAAMDGWAVCGRGPWELREYAQELESGQACSIVTGGLIPGGTTSVLRAEHARIENAKLSVNEKARPGEPEPGQHIRPAGEEAYEGETVLTAGTVVSPAHVALAAVCGHDDLPVLRAPQVALVLTGDEVVDSGRPEPGQVRDTFGPQLPSFISMLGGHVVAQHRIADNLHHVVQALAGQASNVASIREGGADVVITTGGTGISHADHLRAALTELEAEILIDGLSIRPGHPGLLARLPDGRYIVGLPGNPLAAMMTILTLVRPLLAGIQGAPQPLLGAVVAGQDMPGMPGRDRLISFTLEDGMAVPSNWQGSGMMRGLATADGVMVVPADGLTAGESVTTVPLPWKIPTE